MKNIYSFLLLFIVAFSHKIIADSPIAYEIIDIGILDADESEAIAINDNGQVLGRLNYNNQWEVFLWDKDCGMEILRLPKPRYNHEYSYYENLHLNDNGQIAGICQEGVFIWDKEMGSYIIGFANLENLHLLGFNNQGQILISSYKNAVDSYNSHYDIYMMLLWDKGEIKTISNDFTSLFPEYTRGCFGGLLNDEGSVIFHAHKYRDKTLTTKPFLWTNGQFIELFKEYSSDKSVNLNSFDNSGNIILNIEGIGQYFFNSLKKSISRLSVQSNSWNIINSAPQSTYCLPSILKEDFNGVKYYTPGLDIRKLIKPIYPYFTQNPNRINLEVQNSFGWVVGTSDTLYLNRRHAFLAIPVEN